MASGRNQVDYTDIGRVDITMKIDASTVLFDATKTGGADPTMIGKAVTLSGNDTVALCADGEFVFGKLIQVFADDFCRVQVDGYADLPGGASAVLTRGKPIVGALGAASAKGYIREAIVAGGTYAAAEANEALKAIGQIVNNAVTTAVIVDLD